MKKVKIEKLDHFGRGIFFDDKISFVADTIPGEEVEVSKIKETSKYNIYSLDKVISKSPKRVEAKCPYFGICGGCDIQHLSYEDGLDFKLNKVKEIFNKFRINYDDITIESNPQPYYYRNKVELKCLNNKIGFYKINSHELVSIRSCMISSKAINDAIKELNNISLPDCDIIIRSNYNDEVLLWFKSSHDLNVKREDFSKDLKIASIIINDKVIHGEDHLIMKVGNFLFKCSYDAFFQINPYICEKIADYLQNNVKENSVIADLYCGVGFLGILAYSPNKKVYGIEIVENAIKDALINKKINNIEHMIFELGDVADVFNRINNKIDHNIDYLIVDPPRSGLDNKTIDTIISKNISSIFYMSCDPNTLARDLKLLQDYYNIKSVKCFDMFSYTYHIETICILERRKSSVYTKKDQDVINQCINGPLYEAKTDLSKKEYDALVEKLIKDDEVRILKALKTLYWDFNPNRVIDYLISKKDVWQLVSYLDLCNDFCTTKSGFNQKYVVDKLIGENDKQLIKDIFATGVTFFLTDENEKERLTSFIK